MVQVLPSDIPRLREAIQQFSSVKRERLQKALRKIAAKEERMEGYQCPFLHGGACSIHEHRPGVCRMLSSSKAHECAENKFHQNGEINLAKLQSTITMLTHLRTLQAVGIHPQWMGTALTKLEVAPND
jgi:Fe-S-cluster containining protein